MPDLNIKVLTIPKHLYRNYILLGHLETIGFPVVDLINRDQMKFYNGFDWQDYETNAALIQAVVDGGWTQWEKVLQREDCETLRKHGIAVEWGFLNIMRKIAEDNQPALVLESDVKFHSLTFEELLKQWQFLVDAEGYANIKVVQLAFFPQEDLPVPTLTPISDFWAKGAGGRGQYANIVTPAGAKFLMTRDEPTCTIENYFPKYPKTLGFYSSRESHYRYGNLASLLYPHRNQQWWTETYGPNIQGEQL